LVFEKDDILRRKSPKIVIITSAPVNAGHHRNPPKAIFLKRVKSEVATKPYIHTYVCSYAAKHISSSQLKKMSLQTLHTYVVEAKVTNLATLQCGRVLAVPEQVPARHQKLAANLWK
jgi:hypothetical protein